MACCSRVRCIIGMRDECYRHAAQLASWWRTHKVHCYSCLPTRDTRRHHPHQPPRAWASGHLASTRFLFVARPAMETRPSLLCTCGDSSTGPQGPQNDTGSDTAQTYSRRDKTKSVVPRSPSGTRGSLLVSYPLALLSCNRPRSARRSAESHEESSPASTSAIYQYYMHICMGFPAQDASLICSLRTASRHFQCCRIVAATAASAVVSPRPVMPQISCQGTRSLYCE